MLKNNFFALFLLLITLLLIATLETFLPNQQTPNSPHNNTTLSPEVQLQEINKQHPLLNLYQLAISEPEAALIALKSWQSKSQKAHKIELIYALKIKRRVSIYAPKIVSKEQVEIEIKEFSQQHNLKWLAAWLTHLQAKSQIREGNLNDAKKGIDEALSIAEQENLEFLLVDFYVTAGVIYNADNQLTQAQQYFDVGLSIAEKQNDIYRQSIYNNNLGLLYVHLEQWQNALDYLIKAESLYSKVESPDPNFHLIILFNQSFAHIQAGEIETAWEKHNKAMSRLAQNKRPYPYIISLKNLARLYYSQENYKESVLAASNCLAHENIEKYKKQHAICAFEHAKALYAMQRLSEAEASLSLSITLFEDIKHDRFLTKSLLLNAKINEQGADIEKAYTLYKQYYSNERAFLIEDLRLLGSALQLQKVTQQRDLLASQNALSALNKQVDKQKVKMLWLWLLVILFALTWLIWHFYKVKDDNKKLYQLSFKDPLTKASNRRHYYQELENPQLLNTEQLYRLVVVDLDHFKQVNDEYGHDSGDLVLKATAKLLLNTLESDELFVRWGGEEFLMILKDTSNFSERVCSFISLIADTPIDVANKTIKVTTSLGCSNAILISDLRSSDKAFKLADKCLYQAKRDGRNRVVMPEALVN